MSEHDQNVTYTCVCSRCKKQFTALAPESDGYELEVESENADAHMRVTMCGECHLALIDFIDGKDANPSRNNNFRPTTREYFTAAALTGILSNSLYHPKHGRFENDEGESLTFGEWAARSALGVADQVIAALERKNAEEPTS